MAADFNITLDMAGTEIMKISCELIGILPTIYSGATIGMQMPRVLIHVAIIESEFWQQPEFEIAGISEFF